MEEAAARFQRMGDRKAAQRHAAEAIQRWIRGAATRVRERHEKQVRAHALGRGPELRAPRGPSFPPYPVPPPGP
eukprot:2157586-Prymnesium_polylepis.1